MAQRANIYDPSKPGGVTNAYGTFDSQAEADAFSAQSAPPQAAATAGLASAGPGAPTPADGGMGGAPVVAPPSAPAPPGESMGLDMMGTPPESMYMPGQPGQLRQGLGQRLYPSTQSALAGLQKAY